jgi:hypothetical protein
MNQFKRKNNKNIFKIKKIVIFFMIIKLKKFLEKQKNKNY